MVRLVVKLAALAPAFLIGLPLQAVLNRIRPDLARRLPVPFHRYVCRIVGVRIRVVDAAPSDAPALWVANHISWLDIPVLASVRPVSFIAKSEVAGWPVFGTLARLQNTVFVDRQRRLATGQATESLAARLAGGDAMVLFAEGTTSDGQRVLPLRSALLGAARSERSDEGPPVTVRALAIRYTHRNGLPLTRRDMPVIAWYGDMELLPHLKSLLAAGPVDVELSFGPPLTLAHAADRKRVTAEAQMWLRTARAGDLRRMRAESANSRIEDSDVSS